MGMMRGIRRVVSAIGRALKGGREAPPEAPPAPPEAPPGGTPGAPPEAPGAEEGAVGEEEAGPPPRPPAPPTLPVTIPGSWVVSSTRWTGVLRGTLSGADVEAFLDAMDAGDLSTAVYMVAGAYGGSDFADLLDPGASQVYDVQYPLEGG